jgi:membrane-associated phospholipid phosphatase
MGAAMLLDERAAQFGVWLSGRIHGPVKFTTLAQVAKVPGEFYFTLAVAAVALLSHPWKWRAGGLLCLSAIVGGALYTVLKWGVGRHRPVSTYAAFDLVPFAGGWKGLFVAEPNLSFPSGHATCAFATAAALAVLYPRWRWAFYAVAAVTGVERVVERAHYLSDVVAAAGVGILSVHIAIYLATLVIDRNRALETEPASCQAPPPAEPVRPQ